MTLAFLDRDKPLSSPWEVIRWWEIRRWTYNAIVGATGLITLIIYFGMTALFVRMSGDPDIGYFHAFLFMWIALYALAANFCYTAGWISELFLRGMQKEFTDQFAKIAFVAGTVVSVMITLVPGVCFLVLSLFSLVLGIQND